MTPTATLELLELAHHSAACCGRLVAVVVRAEHLEAQEEAPLVAAQAWVRLAALEARAQAVLVAPPLVLPEPGEVGGAVLEVAALLLETLFPAGAPAAREPSYSFLLL